MLIKCYKCTTQRNYINKELELIKETNGVFIQPTNLTDPVLKLELDSENKLLDCNYIVIESLGKSYTGQGVISDNNHFITFYGHIDVLATYKDYILNSTQIIERTSDTRYIDSMLSDSEFQVRTKKQVQQKVINNDIFNPGGLGDRSLCFVLTTIDGYLQPSTTEE